MSSGVTAGLLVPEELAGLLCPTCRGPLSFIGRLARGFLDDGVIECGRCGESFAVRRGLPRLYREREVTGNDRLLRLFYDYLPRLHDPAVRYTLPLFQLGRLAAADGGPGSEEEMRAGYLPRLELDGLAPREDGEPVRILEVGIGTGANLPLLRRALPAGLPVEIWGLDLSEGMLAACRRRLAASPDASVRLVMGDAHALPFAAARFDRVFHVGALGSFRDPARALSEMARVARRGTPVVAVDEQLDSSRAHSVLARATFRLVTFYEAHPHAPVEAVPAGAVDVLAEQVSPFFYCLRFRTPAA